MHPGEIDWRLYAIIDRDLLGDRDIREVAEALAAGGAGVIQLRDKSTDVSRFYLDACVLRNIIRRYGVPLIINDRADVALAAGADGVHIGQEDMPIGAVRQIIGTKKIVGMSVHNREELVHSQDASITYYGVGTIFSSTTKSALQAGGPAILQELRPLTSTPMIAIGGIDIENLGSVFEAGADGVAVVSALLLADDIANRTKLFRHRIDRIATNRFGG